MSVHKNKGFGFSPIPIAAFLLLEHPEWALPPLLLVICSFNFLSHLFFFAAADADFPTCPLPFATEVSRTFFAFTRGVFLLFLSLYVASCLSSFFTPDSPDLLY